MIGTSRLGLDTPQGPDLISQGPSDFSEAFNILDSAALVKWGTQSTGTGMAAAFTSAGVPLVAGCLYLRTDTPIVCYYDGSQWNTIAAYTPTVSVSPIPLGSIEMYTGITDPVDSDGVVRWMICDGRGIAKASYSALDSLWGAQGYPFGSSSSNLNLPDFRQKFPLGKATSGTGSTMGATGGSINHTHTIPALSVPAAGLTIPALAVSGTIPSGINLTANVPNLTVAVNSHLHTLSSAGYAQILVGNAGGYGAIVVGNIAGSFGCYYRWWDNSGWSYDNPGGVGPYPGAALGGGTDAAGATGIAYGTTAVGSTAVTAALQSGTTSSGSVGGSASTSTGTTGSQNPPFLAVNFIVKVL